MYKYMSQHENLLCKDNKIGEEKATKEDYAFLMESSSIDYIIERNCKLTQVGELLDDKNYGIAMRKGLGR